MHERIKLRNERITKFTKSPIFTTLNTWGLDLKVLKAHFKINVKTLRTEIN